MSSRQAATAADGSQCRRVEKPWGWEVIWADTPFYCAKLIHVHAGRRLSLQYHDDKTETQCLLSGKAVLVLESDAGVLTEITMQLGAGYTVLPLRVHRLIAIEDSEIVEVATPERGITVRLEDDYDRGDETEAVRALPDRGWARPAQLEHQQPSFDR
jgi:mannose-6-phosphate isomerase